MNEPALHLKQVTVWRIPNTPKLDQQTRRPHALPGKNSETYELSPDLGRFPLFDVRPFAQRLPVAMATQGGVFLPTYREFPSL